MVEAGHSTADSDDVSSASDTTSSFETGCKDAQRLRRTNQPCLKERVCLKTASLPQEPCLKARHTGKKRKRERKTSRALPSASSSEGDTSTTTTTTTTTSAVSTLHSTDVASAGSDAWTLSQDCALRGMKEADDELSWAEIATTLGRHADDVKARWKLIKRGGVEAEAGRARKAREKQKKTTKTTTMTTTTKTKRKKKGDVSRDDLRSGDEASSESTSCSSSSSSPSSPSSRLDENEERRRQNRYLQRVIRGTLYPSNDTSIEPNDHFDSDDCRALAAAESKHRCSKWLEMQADLYNSTGRMVPLEFIRAKCGESKYDGRI